ncbi:MAG TPA: branched-chain amino acid ABC transporter permease, partial [Blastocatellia bacterium]|nr:branched-chain amino acid ABC transporter permease [Blastocatellia bacterium]
MISQFLVNGFVSGCAYALVALGFALIYNTTKTFHFAHGAIYTLSVYLFYTLLNTLNWPTVLSLTLAICLAGIFGVLTDEVLYRPLVKRGSPLLIQLLSSLGFYVVLVNLIGLVYGNEPKVLRPGVQATYAIGPVILTGTQIGTALTFIVLFIALALILRRTRLGKLIRAMRDDAELVSAIGLDPRRVRRIVFALSSCLACVSAILMGLDAGIDPNIGMAAVLNGAVAVIIGGVGSFEGAVVGALLLGVLQGLAIWQISARWQEAVTFFVLILFLLLRPEGILGNRRRIEERAA